MVVAVNSDLRLRSGDMAYRIEMFPLSVPVIATSGMGLLF